MKKSRLFFSHFHNELQLFTNFGVILPAVGPQAVGAILDPIRRICEAAATVLPQRIQWAVTKQTAEFLRVRSRVAGKVLTIPVLNKIAGHNTHLSIIILSPAPHCKKKSSAVRRLRPLDKPQPEYNLCCRKSPSKLDLFNRPTLCYN